MSSKPSQGAFTRYSISALVIIAAALVQEFGSLILGRKGGAFSHIVWWAMGDAYTWRWALVGAPIIGLLLCIIAIGIGSLRLMLGGGIL